MRPERLRPVVAAVLGALLAACASMAEKPPAPAPAVDRTAVQAAAIASYLDTLQRLVRGGPAEQAEIFAGVKREYDAVPTPSHELRYALALSTAGHAGSDPIAAQKRLRALLATPEALLPAERSLAFLEAQRVDREVQLAAENQRLKAEAERLDREHSATASKRLQAEIDENTRLHQKLDEAQAKLDAIATIERSITQRKKPNEGRNP